jgi:hypothetical protein
MRGLRIITRRSLLRLKELMHAKCLGQCHAYKKDLINASDYSLSLSLSVGG